MKVKVRAFSKMTAQVFLIIRGGGTIPLMAIAGPFDRLKGKRIKRKKLDLLDIDAKGIGHEKG